jgi:YidC/Oxa1 family membrane protein insertase
MWAQMKLNPPPPDPTQKMIFDWMPVIFTFMLASFSAGLVIYWAWNNTLSVIQQSAIMHKHGVKIELLGNLKQTFAGLKNRVFKKANAGARGKTMPMIFSFVVGSFSAGLLLYWAWYK